MDLATKKKTCLEKKRAWKRFIGRIAQRPEQVVALPIPANHDD
jgi:hypothetical protein